MKFGCYFGARARVAAQAVFILSDGKQNSNGDLDKYLTTLAGWLAGWLDGWLAHGEYGDAEKELCDRDAENHVNYSL